MTRFQGLIAAPFTPMNAQTGIDLSVVDRQAALLLESGVRGVFVGGTTGECMSLTVEERLALAERWKDVAGKDLAVLIHVGHACLAEARALAAHAQKIGARAIGMCGPFYLRPACVEDLVDWCASVASAAPAVPFYYYHIPSVTHVGFPMAGFLKAADGRIPTLAGIKFTHEDLLDFGRCLDYEGGRYDMLFGRDEILLSALALGARGAIGSTYNFAAPLFLRLWKAFDSGRREEAARGQRQVRDFVAVLLRFGGLPAGKVLMKRMGVDCGPVRPPLRSLRPEEEQQFFAELERVGFFEAASLRPEKVDQGAPLP
ncbi:MAG TPA: dihydrodipicolinate synthase family protein [Planctomycetota bacterium]|nr:dihydrodipicolinate synthase family protein [Planctomycetota bacterium]